MRPLALLLALLTSGCCTAFECYDAVKGDFEIKHAGQWTEGDARARRLIDSRFKGDGAAAVAMGEPMPVRRLSTAEQMTKRVRFGDSLIPIPSPSAAGTKLFGLGWQPTYVLRGERNAIILLHEDKPATILPIDPEKPIDYGEEKTPSWIYRRMADDLRRDLDQLPRPDLPRP